jgi:SAM-dependent methyltransferase
MSLPTGLDDKNLLSPCCGEGDTDGIDEPRGPGCPEPDFNPPPLALPGRMMVEAFYNAMEVCFDDLPDEPKKILIIGGCRQRDLARKLGFMLPFSMIFVLDPDEAQYRRAQEEVRCRFKFVHSPLEKMVFEDGYFDLTLAHNLFEYVADEDPALAEIVRVTKTNLLTSTHRPLAWRIGGALPGMAGAMSFLGCKPPAKQPPSKAITRALSPYATPGTRVSPFPWQMTMWHRKPL